MLQCSCNSSNTNTNNNDNNNNSNNNNNNNKNNNNNYYYYYYYYARLDVHARGFWDRQQSAFFDVRAVSYTHLTLPTIYSV